MGRDVGCISAPQHIVPCTSQVDGKPYNRFTLEDQDFMLGGCCGWAVSRTLLTSVTNPAFDQCNSLTLQRGFNPFWEWTQNWDGSREKMNKATNVLDGFAKKVIDEKKAKAASKGPGAGPSDEKGLPMDLLDFFMGHAADAGKELSFKELRDIVMNFRACL